MENQNDEELITSENDEEDVNLTNDKNDNEDDITEQPNSENDKSELSLLTKNKQLFARAKKAEEELKKFKSKPQQSVSLDEDIIVKKIDERLEERELKSLDLDEDLKKEIKSYAKLNNVSIGKAKESDYIKFKLEKLEQKKIAEEASVGGDTHNATTTDLKNLDISKLDMWKEEDRKKFEEWKKLNN